MALKPIAFVKDTIRFFTFLATEGTAAEVETPLFMTSSS
jgi:hypothetical protein